jgi:ATP-dependent protease HslVU (ClpYQ) peptidase subunit
MLLGCNGRLWSLTHMHAIPHLDGVAAIGSGEGPAIGAVDALLPFTGPPWQMLPAEVVFRAVRIGITRDRYSADPILVELLPAREDSPGD